MTTKHCQICRHSDLFRRRMDGRCGLTIQGSKDGPCLCACIYSDSAVLVRVRESGHYLKSEEQGELTPNKAEAARLTLDGARWFERRFPQAIDIVPV